MDCHSFYQSPIGPLLLVSNGVELTGLWTEKLLQTHLTELQQDDLPLFLSVKAWLDDYFSGKNPDLSHIPLNPSGSAFQELIWKLLLEIPYGQSVSYGYLAKQAALLMDKQAMSAQAVGNAVGKNPISILIPCHRVLGATGKLTGYAGGLDIKSSLLKLEGITALP